MDVSWTVKKTERRRIDAFELCCWRRLLRVPWTARRSNQSTLKEISPRCSLEGVMLKLKLQYFGHLMWRADSFGKTLLLLLLLSCFSCVWLCVTPWTAVHQAALSITNSRSPPKHMSIVSVMPSNHLILCHSLLLLPPIFPASGSFQMSQLSTSGGQSIGVSTSVLPMNTQDWSPLGWTGWISLQSMGLSKVFSNTTIQKH